MESIGRRGDTLERIVKNIICYQQLKFSEYIRSKTTCYASNVHTYSGNHHHLGHCAVASLRAEKEIRLERINFLQFIFNWDLGLNLLAYLYFQLNIKSIMKSRPYLCFWFDGKAREAAELYCSLFPNSQILSDGGLTVNFELNGQRIMGLNGGPMFLPTEANSLVIECENQAEIDHYWNGLTANGGEEGHCGWCKDPYGFSWQVIPAELGKWMSHPSNGQKITEAFLKMKKFDYQVLETIYQS